MRTATTRLLTAAAALAVAASTALTGPAANAASTSPCGNTDLKASYHGGGGAAGTFYGWVVLRNTSGHACHTGGYGGVSYVGHGDGTQIGASARRQGASGVRTYVLRPGQRLRSRIGEVEALNYPRRRCHPTHVDGFRIYVPNATKSQYVVHPRTGCRNAKVHLLFQKPYRRP
jgi:Protein of unknown function (DUF4232)